MRQIVDKRRQRRPHSFCAAIIRQLKPLQILDNWHGPVAWTYDVAVIAFAIYLYSRSVYWLPISAILIGSRQRALATLLHESSHLTLCRNRVLNFVLGSVLAGWLVFQIFTRYRKSHVKAHHPHLGDENLDPDARNYVEQRLFEKDHHAFVRRHLIPQLLGLRIPENLKYLVMNRLLPHQISNMSSKELWELAAFIAYWLLLLGVLAYTDMLFTFVVLWLLPYLTTFQAINWIIEVAEHFPLIRLFDCEIEMTRNRHGSAIENFFTGIHGEGWHLVHHLRPGIPFWNLRRAHEVMMQDPDYAAANYRSGGLFTSGPTTKPSIISLLRADIVAASETNHQSKGD